MAGRGDACAARDTRYERRAGNAGSLDLCPFGRAQGRLVVLRAILPVSGVPCAVKDCNNDDCVIGNDKQHLVRESACQGAACISMNHGMRKRIAQDGSERSVNGGKEVGAQTRHPTLVPVECLLDIRLRFGPDNQLASHFRLVILSRTTDQGAPAVGS